MFLNKQLLVRSLAIALPLLCGARSALAYIDLAPTLSKLVSDAPTIAVVEVTAYDRGSHAVTLKPVQALKGPIAPDLFTHTVAPTGGGVPRQIVQWAMPGSRAVLFQSRTATRGTALMCFGTGWYQVNSVGTNVWKLGAERPDLPLAYYGNLRRLSAAVRAILNGKGAVITVVAYGADSEGASFDLALNRQHLPGVVRLQRIRVNASMPGTVASASANPSYFIGVGVVDEKALPELLEQLESPDANVRANAAEDLGTLGRKARSAATALAGLLNDPSPQARFASASALLRISPKDSRGIPVLLAGLTDREATARLYAAAAAGYSGQAGAPLAGKLAALLSDPEESVRLTALESISMLGPAAEKAAPALIPLLDSKELAIDAADALGRIGPAAAPALKKLAAMLSSDQSAVRWAAVRGMSQIGGAEAHPAVDFMVRQMATATEVEGYNMMIYFALLGPVAQDATTALSSFRIKNPWLPNATLWAINTNRGLPWLGGGGMGGGGRGGGRMRGGPDGGGVGGGPGGGGMGGGAGGLMYPSYVRELGFRLRALSPKLANSIMDDTAGTVPKWGYTLLNAAPDSSLEILTPNLKHTNIVMRERAGVALGFMGEDAAPAKASVEAALAKAPTEREQKLLEWALRQIDMD